MAAALGSKFTDSARERPATSNIVDVRFGDDQPLAKREPQLFRPVFSPERPSRHSTERKAVPVA